MPQVIQAADEQLEAALRARPVRGLRSHRRHRRHRHGGSPPGSWGGFGWAISFNMAKMR